MSDFISDDEMAKLEGQGPDFISDDEMAKLEAPPLASVEGTTQAAKSALSGASHLAGGAPLGAALDTGLDALLKASGGLFLPEGSENPYEDVPAGQMYNENLAGREAKYQNSKEAAPLAYGGGQLALAAALPSRGLGQIVSQGAATGAVESQAHGLEKLGDVALGGALAGGVTKGLEKLGSVSNKVRDVIANSKYGRAFKGGSDVQKYIDPMEQTALANRVTGALDDVTSNATKSHAQARQAFTNELGQTPVNASGVADDIEASLGRYGEDFGDFGPLSGREKQELAQYTQALKEPRSAQELYKVWDDIKTKVDYNDAQPGSNSEFNTQLKALQRGIKEKLHEVSPDLQAADESMAGLMDNAKLLRAGQREGTAESFLSTLGGRNKGNRREALEATLKDSPDVLRDVGDFQTYQSFNGQGGFGSEYGVKNLAGAALGSAAGYQAGGDMQSGSVGAALGATLSNPKTQRALLTGAGDAFKKATGMSGSIVQKLSPKFQQVLQKAADKGGNALAVTHFLLQSTDPEYQQELKNQANDPERAQTPGD
jgi:hypothetical protein